MNNFTKQELKDIQSCINEAYRSCCVNPKISFNLRTKIKSMIETYCEHEQYTPVLGDIDCFLCDKCNEVILK